MNIKYQCKNCAIFFKNQIDLNYHWFGCRKESKEYEDYKWLEKNNHESLIKCPLLKTKNIKTQKSISNLYLSNSSLVNCPNCDTLVRSDRLQKHINKVHVFPSRIKSKLENLSLKKEIVKPNIVKFPVPPISQNKKNRKKKRATAKLQNGKIIENQPTTKFGEKNGTILKQENSNGIKIRYEQSLCSCNGSNERCMRCDGTGYYVKKIIEESSEISSKSDSKSYKYSLKTTQESIFSNDARGDFYGVREQGRFSSNPLHDDYE